MNGYFEHSVLPESKPPGQSGVESMASRIAQHPFLCGLSPHLLQILADCAMPRHFEAGELVLREGDPASRFYLIEKGLVSLECHLKESGVTRIETIGSGELLGWSWLFPPYLSHFDAKALEPTDTIFLYGTPIRDECESDQEFGYEFFKRMAEAMLKRLQATRRRLAENIA